MKPAIDVYEIAMGIIANAHGGNWDEASKEWQDAAKRFRDEYHTELDIHVRLESELVRLHSKFQQKANSTELITFEIVGERKRQDRRWGGPKHDDLHRDVDWTHFRGLREERIIKNGERSPYNRDDLIEIAALAVAQIEALDRFHDNKMDLNAEM